MATSAQESANARPPDIVFSPERRRILSGQGSRSLFLQRSEDALLDLFNAPCAGDPAAARRLRIAGRRPLCVIIDERTGLRAIDLEALAHRFLAVVIAQDQRLSGHVVAS